MQPKSEKPPNIGDLPEDTLLHMFRVLDFTSLLSVAETCKLWNKYAGTIYAEKYGSKEIIVDRMVFSNFREQRYKIESDTITISKPSTLVSLLRGVGNQITRVTIDFECMDPFHSRQIENFINRNCAGSLRELQVRHCREMAMNEITKPFRKLEQLSIVGGFVGQHISSFNKLFPKLQRLELHSNEITNRSCLEMKFTNLHEIIVDIESRTKIGFRVLDLTKALRLNQQIRALTLRSNVNQSVVSIVDKLLPNLGHLKLEPSASLFTCQKGSLVKATNITRLTLSAPDLNQFLCIRIPIQFANLQELDMSIRSHIDLFFDFVCRMNTLKKINLRFVHETAYAIIDGPLVAVLELPNLVELSLTDFTVVAKKGIIESIMDSQSLTEFHMNFCNKMPWFEWLFGVDDLIWDVTGDDLHVSFRRID